MSSPPNLSRFRLKKPGEFIRHQGQLANQLRIPGAMARSHTSAPRCSLQTQTSMVHDSAYRGSGPALRTLSGQVQVFNTTPPSVMGQVQVGNRTGWPWRAAGHPGFCSNVPTSTRRSWL
jgi:tripartite-type tricarboxylate transporter receptor subunit TctC